MADMGDELQSVESHLDRVAEEYKPTRRIRKFEFRHVPVRQFLNREVTPQGLDLCSSSALQRH